MRGRSDPGVPRGLSRPYVCLAYAAPMATELRRQKPLEHMFEWRGQLCEASSAMRVREWSARRADSAHVVGDCATRTGVVARGTHGAEGIPKATVDDEVDGEADSPRGEEGCF